MATTIPQIFLEQVAARPEGIAQMSKDEKGVFQPHSFAQLFTWVSEFSCGLASLGVQRGDRVGLISDNRKEWLVADLSILGLGAADVPRGTDATLQELSYILSWSECSLAILENEKQLAKVMEVRPSLPGLNTIVLFDPVDQAAAARAQGAGLRVLDYAAVLASGAAALAKNPEFYRREAAEGRRKDTATIIYTSGTTGDPKGVVLSHGNFLHQTDYLPSLLGVKPGQIFLSVLPVWHSFERIVQYIALAAACTLAYSKPVGSILLADMKAVQPHWFPSVPRIWESIKDGVSRQIKQSGFATRTLFNIFVGIGETYAYFLSHLLGRSPAFRPRSRILESLVSLVPVVLLAPLRGLGWLLVFRKIKAKLGSRFIAGISGGGALPASVDRFFDAIGILVLEGYGLTETAPVLGVRLRKHPVAGTVGPIHRGTEIRILSPAGRILGPGRKGLIQVRGPQVMAGYYKRPDLTEKVLDAEGWLNTGDLGMLTVDGEIRITGRAKDTIVLRGGENIEPAPLEQTLGESEYILQAVVLGQDQKYLAALIIPQREAVLAWAAEHGIPSIDYETTLQQAELHELIEDEISRLVNPKHGFKAFERIYRFALLPEAFEVGKELSAKQELKRHTINTLYHKKIARLFQQE